MLTLQAAREHAAQMAELHGEPWLVFKTPSDAPCNQSPCSALNSGRYAACRASEREEYEQGGVIFIATCPAV